MYIHFYSFIYLCFTFSTFKFTLTLTFISFIINFEFHLHLQYHVLSHLHLHLHLRLHLHVLLFVLFTYLHFEGEGIATHVVVSGRDSLLVNLTPTSVQRVTRILTLLSLTPQSSLKGLGWVDAGMEPVFAFYFSTKSLSTKTSCTQTWEPHPWQVELGEHQIHARLCSSLPSTLAINSTVSWPLVLPISCTTRVISWTRIWWAPASGKLSWTAWTWSIFESVLPFKSLNTNCSCGVELPEALGNSWRRRRTFCGRCGLNKREWWRQWITMGCVARVLRLSPQVPLECA